MKSIRCSVLTAAAALPILLFASLLSEPALGRSAPSAEHYCMVFYTHGSDCGFTSEKQCLATALGIGAQCFETPSSTSSASLYGSVSMGIRDAHGAYARPVRHYDGSASLGIREGHGAYAGPAHRKLQ
ncbi:MULTISPECIES: DUF3551 domain-containing protein [unclassified Bradyrhizobium]|uniref:DUF3551 domain-containing protein n=1 Tax=unclassified Bradyrhizobium TaxID=2631580 RepID=UPI001FF93C16|nr:MULTISPECIES: DUF3551 domain-containing protein [unclassified Bradyrhizobium]MCK1711663.1 DUF3551 domain-containing protein [Bradyrhizobium sp. 143]MCK1724015.1 DUF3551 domain-containing protein [Bradyrhizobium sp. 142]